MKQLPQLNAIRAFETVARLGTIVAAAEELAVTPSAVGQQVKLLEEVLGVVLFERRGRRLVLTRVGGHYAERLSEGFQIIKGATDQIRRRASEAPVTINATPAIALRWLVQVLDQLRRERGLSFQIDASSRTADLRRGEADLDIRYGRTLEPGLVADLLFTEEVFPIATPEYLAAQGINGPADLCMVRLLTVDDWGARGGTWSGWDEWFSEYGVVTPALDTMPRFTALDGAVEAALAGQGVAIGSQRHLHSARMGSLVKVLPNLPGITYSVHLLSLPEMAETSQVRRIRRALVAEAAGSDQILHDGAF